MIDINSLRNVKNHFNTITEHKLLVMEGCFKVGLYKQGLMHDLSKYSPTEFLTGVHYFQGNRSPNAAEREDKGYSEAWMHHKGRNRHHYEYWTDLNKAREMAPVKMPLNYVVEMLMDRIAACKVYRKDNYTDSAALEYYERAKESRFLHPETQALLEELLHMLADKGEAYTFYYIRTKLLPKGTY